MSAIKRGACALFATAAVAAAFAIPASAQQSGLVNVDVSNVLNNNDVVANVTVPINAAANVCGVSVPVLSQQLSSGPVSCTSTAGQRFTILGFAA